jgi:hypothetical protein
MHAKLTCFIFFAQKKQWRRPFTHPKWFHEFHPSGGVNASPLFKALLTGNNCNATLVARSNAHRSTIVIGNVNGFNLQVSRFFPIIDDVIPMESNPSLVNLAICETKQTNPKKPASTEEPSPLSGVERHGATLPLAQRVVSRYFTLPKF